MKWPHDGLVNYSYQIKEEVEAGLWITFGNISQSSLHPCRFLPTLLLDVAAICSGRSQQRDLNRLLLWETLNSELKEITEFT